MKSAREWKEFYARERVELGEAGLIALLDRARVVEAPERGALVFPHTRLEASGELAAAAALAVVRAGCDEVLALGILHGARDADQELVRRAREGAPSARAALRRVHGPDTPNDGGHWTEEFSLDGFIALVELAAKRERRKPPRIVQRYPFLGGERPAELAGADELRERVARGAVLVATADPIHHGAGYGAREEDRLPARTRRRWSSRGGRSSAASSSWPPRTTTGFCATLPRCGRTSATPGR